MDSSSASSPQVEHAKKFNIQIDIDPRVFDPQTCEMVVNSITRSLPLSLAFSSSHGSPSQIDVQIGITTRFEPSVNTQDLEPLAGQETSQIKSSPTSPPPGLRMENGEFPFDSAWCNQYALLNDDTGDVISSDKAQEDKLPVGTLPFKPFVTKRSSPPPFKPLPSMRRPMTSLEDRYPSVVPAPPKPTKELPTRYPRFMPTSLPSEMDFDTPIPALGGGEENIRDLIPSTFSEAAIDEYEPSSSDQSSSSSDSSVHTLSTSSSPGNQSRWIRGFPPTSPWASALIDNEKELDFASCSDAEPTNEEAPVAAKPLRTRHTRPSSAPTETPHRFPRQFEELPWVHVKRGPDGLAINSPASMRKGLFNLPMACNLEAGDLAWTEPIMFQLPIEETTFGRQDRLGFTKPGLLTCPDGRLEVFIDADTQECMRKKPTQAFLVPVRYIDSPILDSLAIGKWVSSPPAARRSK